MANLLAKRYKNNKAKAEADAEKGKKLSAQQDGVKKQELKKKSVVEKVEVIKESKTLMVD